MRGGNPSETGDFPMAGGGVLATRSFRHFSIGCSRVVYRADAPDSGKIAQTEASKMGKMQSPAETRGINQRVACGVVAIFDRIGHGSNAERVNYQNYCAAFFHVLTLPGCQSAPGYGPVQPC